MKLIKFKNDQPLGGGETEVYINPLNIQWITPSNQNNWTIIYMGAGSVTVKHHIEEVNKALNDIEL